MAQIRLSKFRASSPFHRIWQRTFEGKTSIALWVWVILCHALLFYSVPKVWKNRSLNQVTKPHMFHAIEQLQHVQAHWLAPLDVPPFIRGDEPILAAWLQQDPLLVAFRREEGDTDVWLREQNRLERTDQNRIPSDWLEWMNAADVANGSHWTPPASQNRDNKCAVVVVRCHGWTALRLWCIGSEATESFLRNALGPNPELRMGLRRSNVSERVPVANPKAWNKPPNIQVEFDQHQRSRMELKNSGTAFGEGWEIASRPSQKLEKYFQAVCTRARYEATAVLFALTSLWGLALYSRRRAKQRERADMDRLASMTHSLKTPLAVLKLRCDSLRLGKLQAAQAQAQFLCLGEEVDQLACIIDQSLQVLGDKGKSRQKETVLPSYIRTLADELKPAFEAESRELDLQLANESGKAHLPSLRTALVTLLENALIHGRGPVSLQTFRFPSRLRIQVSNQGADLEPDQINYLGKPFFRARHPEAEGFRKEGNGLGLFLLSHVAEQEGWGLELSRHTDGTFLATLEIHA